MNGEMDGWMHKKEGKNLNIKNKCMKKLQGDVSAKMSNE